MPVVSIDHLSQEEAEAFAVADNHLQDLGTIDHESLHSLICEMDETLLDAASITQAYVDELDGLLANLESIPDDPAVDDLPQSAPEVLLDKWEVKPGDIWSSDAGVIVCGSSTDESVLSAIPDGISARLVLTDPPYGVAYKGKTEHALEVFGDAVDEDQLAVMFKSAMDIAERASSDGSIWIATVPAGPLQVVFIQDWIRRGILRQCLVWVKDQFVMGRSEYHYRHEPIMFGWKPGGRRRVNKDRKRDSVWEFDRPKQSVLHPTMKPVGLWEKAIVENSSKGDWVYDPFLGSGTTAVACYQSGRRFIGVELAPEYVAVALERLDLLGCKMSRIERPGVF